MRAVINEPTPGTVGDHYPPPERPDNATVSRTKNRTEKRPLSPEMVRYTTQSGIQLRSGKLASVPLGGVVSYRAGPQ